MRARFEVHRAFPLEERALLVLAGSIQRGMVQVGMTARLEGDEEAFTRRVHGVEFLDPADDGPEDEAPGVSEPCLTFYCRDADRLREWLEMEWEGRCLELRW